jgi:hypothetical protein
MTLSIGIQRNNIECHYAECCDYLNVILSVVMLKVDMLSVVEQSTVAVLALGNSGYGAQIETT